LLVASRVSVRARRVLSDKRTRGLRGARVFNGDTLTMGLRNNQRAAALNAFYRVKMWCSDDAGQGTILCVMKQHDTTDSLTPKGIQAEMNKKYVVVLLNAAQCTVSAQ
jgi:hypothetical protein